MKAAALIIFLTLALLAPMALSHACNTIDLMDTFKAYDGNPPALLLARPVTQMDWITPDGHFHIHYDITGNNAVYNANEDLNPADGIPDYVNRTADYLALAYDSLITSIGFDPPPFDGIQGGDSLYDIYLTDNPGLTTPEAPTNQYPGRPAYSSFIQLGHDLRYPVRYGDDPLPFLKASVVHEYFHAIEFAYRAYSANEYTYWWFESCANWAEERVFDDLNDVYYSLPGYLSKPYSSLYHTEGSFIYGSWLWPEYLCERFGPALLIRCWEKFAGFDFAVTAISFALHEAGADLNEEYCLHVIWNYFTGSNWEEDFYQEGAAFDTTVIIGRTHSSYPVDWIGGPVPLENMSSSYIVFTRPQNPKVPLMIEYYNSSPERQAVCLATIRPGLPVQFSIYNIDSGLPQTFRVNEFGGVTKVVMMPVWLFEGSPRLDSTTYQYRAFLEDTLVDAIDETGLPIKNFTLEGAYPNPFNGSVLISFQAPAALKYTIRIYDIVGRAVVEHDGISSEGLNTYNWQAPDYISSGTLFYVVDFGQKKLAGKMSLLK